MWTPRKAEAPGERQNSQELPPKVSNDGPAFCEISGPNIIPILIPASTTGEVITPQEKSKRRDTMIPRKFRFDLGGTEINFEAPSISIDASAGIEMELAESGGNPSKSDRPFDLSPCIFRAPSVASSESVSETFADLVDRWISEESSLETLPPNVATSIRFD